MKFLSIAGQPQTELLTRLRGVLGELNPAEAKLARSILKDPVEALESSVDTLAAHAGVSTATVIRFCRSIGFQGLRDFRLALAVELKQKGNEPTLSPTAHIAQRILAANVQALEDTVALLDTSVVEQVAESLCQASNIAAFAAGLSAPIAQDAAHRLQRLGLPTHYFAEQYNQLIRADNLVAGQVALMISHSGHTSHTVRCAELARARGAITVAITSAPHAPLAQLVDLCLITATTEHGEEAVASRLAHLAVVDIICGALQELAPEQTQVALARARKIEVVTDGG